MTEATDAVGLCVCCRHARRLCSDRGSAFWLCGRAATDRRFPKYPRLPVLACPGYEEENAADGGAGGGSAGGGAPNG
jgi:hypothetical protein